MFKEEKKNDCEKIEIALKSFKDSIDTIKYNYYIQNDNKEEGNIDIIYYSVIGYNFNLLINNFIKISYELLNKLYEVKPRYLDSRRSVIAEDINFEIISSINTWIEMLKLSDNLTYDFDFSLLKENIDKIHNIYIPSLNKFYEKVKNIIEK